MKIKYYYKLQLLLIFKTIIIIIFGCSREGKSKIVMWNFDNEHAETFLSREVEKFNSKNSGINVEYSSKEIGEILNELKKGSPKVNLIRCPSEYLYDIKKTNSVINPGKIFNKEFFDKFLDQALLSVTIDSEIYGIPDNYGNNLLFYYNKSLIKKPPVYISDMIKSASRLSKYNSEIYGLVFDYYNPRFIQPWWSAFGAEIINEDGNIDFNSRNNKDTLLFIYKLKYDYNIVPRYFSHSESVKWFTEGRAGFFIDDLKNYPEYEAKLNENLGICLFPKLKKNGKRANSWASSYCYIILKKMNKHQLEAVRVFVEDMTSERMQYKWIDADRFPSLKVVDDKVFKNELQREIRKSLLETSAKADNEKVKKIYKSLRPYLEDLMNNKISPDITCEKSQEYLEKIQTVPRSKNR